MIVSEAMEKCDVQYLKKQDIKTLSGGEFQRVYLAMISAQEHNIIILSEPTNHLDIKYQIELLTLLKDIMKKKNITIICILYDLNLTLKILVYTLLLKDGEVYAQDVTQDVLTKENIKNIFKIDVNVSYTNEKKTIDYII